MTWSNSHRLAHARARSLAPAHQLEVRLEAGAVVPWPLALVVELLVRLAHEDDARAVVHRPAQRGRPRRHHAQLRLGRVAAAQKEIQANLATSDRLLRGMESWRGAFVNTVAGWFSAADTPRVARGRGQVERSGLSTQGLGRGRGRG